MPLGQDAAHRLRCVTVKAGVVNICPECGHQWVTDFHWNFALDPAPELGVIFVNDDEEAREFVNILREIAPTTYLPCLPSCAGRE